jgi:hypothetical protein
MWDMMLYHWLNGLKHFEEMYCLRLRGLSGPLRGLFKP